MRASRYNFVFRSENAGRALLFNSLTCALVEVQDSLLILLERTPTDSACLSEAQQRFVRQMLRCGCLVDDAIDELLILKYRYQRFKYRTRVMQLTIAPTLQCNFACPYCFERPAPAAESSRSSAARMSAQTRAELVDFVARAAAGLSRLDVSWFGGEPLLAGDIVRELSAEFIRLADAHAVRYAASLVTNGYLLDEPAERIDRLKAARIDHVQVTLDGPPEVHDRRRQLKATHGPTFARILENVKRMRAARLPVTLRINVDERNQARIGELLDLLRDEGLSDIPLYPAPIVGETPGCASVHTDCLSTTAFHRFRTELLPMLRARGLSTAACLPKPDNMVTACAACVARSFVVDPDGNLYKCWQEIGDRARRVGHVRTYGRESDRIAKMREIRWLTWDPFENPECRNCRFLPICLGKMCVYRPLLEGGKPACCAWKTELDSLISCLYTPSDLLK